MSLARAYRPRALAAALALAFATLPARAFLGFGDTSFVTVIANPAEAANWASELERLNDQLAAAQGTLQTVGDLRAYAGDPRAAVAALRDLQEITGAISQLSAGSQTDADLLRAWQALGASQRLSSAAALLQSSGAGATMQVFGQSQPRDPSIYAGLAQDANALGQMRSQISGEQSARGSVAAELALAWVRFRAATTESGKQAILSEISQLQAQNQVMDTRRRAMLDDLDLSDRQARNDAAVRSKAADEQLLAESAILNADAASRAQAAQAQRMATLQKQAPAAPATDYSGIRLWTTADAGGQAQ
jgi:hypothetical protein